MFDVGANDTKSEAWLQSASQKDGEARKDNVVEKRREEKPIEDYGRMGGGSQLKKAIQRKICRHMKEMVARFMPDERASPSRR